MDQLGSLLRNDLTRTLSNHGEHVVSSANHMQTMVTHDISFLHDFLAHVTGFIILYGVCLGPFVAQLIALVRMTVQNNTCISVTSSQLDNQSEKEETICSGNTAVGFVGFKTLQFSGADEILRNKFKSNKCKLTFKFQKEKVFL